jgi:hypothetical protein
MHRQKGASLGHAKPRLEVPIYIISSLSPFGHRLPKGPMSHVLTPWTFFRHVTCATCVPPPPPSCPKKVLIPYVLNTWTILPFCSVTSSPLSISCLSHSVPFQPMFISFLSHFIPLWSSGLIACLGRDFKLRSTDYLCQFDVCNHLGQARCCHHGLGA